MMVNKATTVRVTWLQLQQQHKTRLGMQELGNLMSEEFKSKSNVLLPIRETTITGIMTTGIMVTMVTIVVVVDIVMVAVSMRGNHISKIICMVHQEHSTQVMAIVICVVSIINYLVL